MNKFYLCVASLSLLLATTANATEIGYAKDKINRSYTFRLGSSETQGQAIRLSASKLSALKGKSIDAAEFVVGSKNTNDKTMHVFITTSLDGEPIAEGTLTITKALSKLKWTLDKPYTITGNEENLYIGYTAEIKSNYKMLIADGSYDIRGCNYAIKDGEWVDTYGTNQGSAHIYINVDGAPDYADVIMGKSNFDGYFKAGDDSDISARFINAGTVAINSFDADVTVGTATRRQHFENLNIAPKDAYSFKLDGINSSEEGNQNVEVYIQNVNNDVNTDPDLSDNLSSGNIFFYPHNMERSLLVEGFTGQDCPNCPNGHLVINNAIALAKQDLQDSIVEVSHHAGYYPDIFTMAEDDAYRFYYGNPSSTFAPAVMVNRNPDSSVSSFPVVNTVLADVYQLMYHASQSKPYVSLNLETSLDENTRELKVKFQIKPHTDMPTDKTLFNVFLVQDGLKAYQSSGGSDYTHNRVFRGTLTDNSWGILAQDLTPGEITTWEKTVTIPEAIHSSYWTDDLLQDGMYGGKYKPEQTDIAAVLENMTLVAYVAQYDNEDNTKNVVYNSIEVKLGDSYMQGGFGAVTGVDNVAGNADNACINVVNGKVSVHGASRVSVYNVAGELVDADKTLSNGIYIVKAVVGGHQMAKKVLVK